MVYYFKTQHRGGGGDEEHEEYIIYMGKDKTENEKLISYGLPEDCWFHVDDLSSAHVYLRMKPGQTLDDIPPEVVHECAALVKANSIVGCKKAEVMVVYTRWKNLKKTSDMVEGQVGFHRPNNLRRVKVEGRNNAIVKALLKTRTERTDTSGLYDEQQARLAAIRAEEKEKRRREQARIRATEKERIREAQERSYDRVMVAEHMVSNTDMKATADNSAAEEFEDDFF